MKDLQLEIREIVSAAQSPALLCSWGKDSSLLLYHARQVKPDIAIYYFGNHLPEAGSRLVVDEGVTVYSFAPRQRRASGLYLLEEYRFNGRSVPMMSDVRISDQCTHKFPPLSVADFFFPNDLVLWGYRRSDWHPLWPDMKFEQKIQIGHTRFVAPLYNLSDADVLRELQRLELQHIEDGPVEICNSCLHALADFQERSTPLKETRYVD